MSDALTVDLLFAYVGIITTATVSIYAGSLGSLPVSPSFPCVAPCVAVQFVELARRDA
jgi:hypothetical protein